MKGLGSLFGKIGRAIGNFFKNLAKDPLSTVLMIVGAFLTAGALIVAFPALAAYELAVYAITVGLAVLAQGAQIGWLKIALSLIGFVVGSYNILFNWAGVVEAASTMFGVTGTALKALQELSVWWRLFLIGVNAFFTYATMVEVRDGIFYSDALEETASDLVEAVTGVATGALSGLLSSPIGWVVAAVGALFAYSLLTNGSSTSVLTIDQKED